MGYEEIDMTGKPPSVEDIDEAIKAATKLMHPALMMKIPPEIAVNAGNIRRCLIHLRQLAGKQTP